MTSLPKLYRYHYATLKVHVGVGDDCPGKAGIPLTCPNKQAVCLDADPAQLGMTLTRRETSGPEDQSSPNGHVVKNTQGGVRTTSLKRQPQRNSVDY